MLPFCLFLVSLIAGLSTPYSPRPALCIAARIKAERALRKAQARRYITRQQRSQASAKGSTRKTPLKREEYRSHRLGDFTLINIASLRSSDPVLRSLARGVVVAWLDKTYSHVPDWRSSFSSRLTTRMTNSRCKTLAELVDKGDRLYPIFYKIYRGTSTVGKEEGYPPLADVLAIDERGGLINGRLASVEQLRLILPEGCVQEILRREKDRYRSGHGNGILSALTAEELAKVIERWTPHLQGQWLLGIVRGESSVKEEMLRMPLEGKKLKS